MNWTPTSFANVPVGTEFLWGSYRVDDMNWGCKRSSRTADYRPRIMGKLSNHMDWGYWSKNETVYILK